MIREPGTDCVESDAQGHFIFEGELPAILRVQSDLYATVFEGMVHPVGDGPDPVLVVAFRIPLSGVVVDPQGRGVAGARLSLHYQGSVVEFPGDIMGASRPAIQELLSAEDGRFSFSSAPEIKSASVRVSAAAYVPVEVAVPRNGATDLRIVLGQAAAKQSVIRGHVYLPDGNPAAGALVCAGAYGVTTDSAGKFALEYLEPPELGRVSADRVLELRAALSGYQGVSMTLPKPEQARAAGWPQDIHLQLGGPPLTIGGQVVDEHGEPLRGIRVRALDMTPFGLVMGELAGVWQSFTLEELSGGGEVHSASSGSFVLSGLLPRAYRVEAIEYPSLLRVVSQPIEAGVKDVEIVLDRRKLGRFAGRIVDRQGRGILGVGVAVLRKQEIYLAIGDVATTDEDGAFSLEAVDPSAPYLWLNGESIVPEVFREIPPDADPEHLELIVSRRCKLQLEWGDWQERADELRVVGEGDVPLELVEQVAGSIAMRKTLSVGQGLSAVFSCPDAATRVIPFLAGEEVARIELHLRPGSVELLRL